MNPLFLEFYNYVKDQARQDFQRSTTGSILKEIESLTRSKSGDSARLQRLTGELIKAAKGGGLGHALKGSELGKSFRQVQRYAAGGAKDALLEAMFRSLGPLGEVFRTFLRPKRQSLSTIERELTAAKNLLQIFRPDLLRGEKPPITTRIPANMPPARPLSPTGPGRPLMSSRFVMPPDAAEAQKLLESLGFTVTPPGKKPPKDTTYITTQAGDRVALKRGAKPLPYKPDDPILTGAMIKVESSNVHSIGFIYDHDEPAHSVLKVRFLQTSKHDSNKKIAGPMYFYYRVPPDVFNRFRIAASKGKFVWDKLRVRGTVTGHQFPYDLQGIAEEYVPRKATRYGPNEYYIPRRVKVVSATGQPMGFRESRLGAQLVQTLPNRGTPNRGNQGTPNRGNSGAPNRGGRTPGTGRPGG